MRSDKSGSAGDEGTALGEHLVFGPLVCCKYTTSDARLIIIVVRVTQVTHLRPKDFKVAMVNQTLAALGVPLGSRGSDILYYRQVGWQVRVLSSDAGQ